MKPFISLIMILLFANLSSAQDNDYDKLWKEVAKHEADGLTKSALETVETIAARAKKDDNTPQEIKALLHKSKYALTLEEDAQLNIINTFKTEISKSQIPTKNVLENMLATLYWQYFQQHRYQFYNRTNTEEKVDTEDFRTWDLQTLFDEIQLHYNSSLQNGLLLQQTSLSEYSAIISEQEGSKAFRPTLYDLLSHNALQFYKTDENSITKPAYKFEIDNPKFLGTAENFSTLRITSKDSTSLQLQALKVYQDLIQFHLKDKNPQALVDVDIDRLKFVSQNATFDTNEDVLLNTLKASSDQWDTDHVSGLYDFEIASLWNLQGNRYNEKTNPDVRWKIKDALELCNVVINKLPKTRAAQQCEALKSQITRGKLNITTESVIPIEDYSKLLIRYTNIVALNFKLYKVDASQITEFNNRHRDDKKLEFLSKKTIATQFDTKLKNEGDYQNHSTEIVVPQLPNGHYIIMAKTDDDNTFAFQTLQVTNFAVVDKSSNDEIIFQFIDRRNGKPQVGVLAKLRFQNDYNSSFKSKSLVSNSKGELRFKKDSKRYMNLSIALSKDGESAYYDGYYVYRNNGGRNYNENDYKSFLFTDRSIYRPGQTVYFKGITMETKAGKSSVLENQLVTATLFNVNGETVKELKLKTNAYGSVASEFILPDSGLTGDFRIELNSDSVSLTANVYFSVEEYKRPKFKTTFNPITETFKVNDSLTVNGNALAYAGSNITDAKVIYRVHRKVQYPSWYYWYRPWFNSEPQEIAHGETTTNAKGEFDITFKAIPDESVDKSSLPIFNYEVTADVTDLNGETRSATTVVNVGYHALLAAVEVKSQLDKTKKDHKLTIDTKNLNGEFVPAKGHIKIYKLAAPDRVLRKRPWNAPDYQVISKEEFITKFPHEAYKDEANPINWDKGELVFETTFDTEKSKEVTLGNIKKWDSGQYVIILESKDKFGQTVKDEARTNLFSEDDKSLADHQLFTISTNADSYSEGQNVELTLASAAEDLTVTVSVEKDHKIVNTHIVPLSNNKKIIAIPVTKDDVGGFAIHYSFAAFNSFTGATLNISVPYPKSDLEIETLTFRDKLQPGTDETWSFKIKGPKGEKVAAELLASMYDASLDQFKPHAWSFNPIDMPTYYAQQRINAGKSFGTGNFRVFNQNNAYPNYYQQQYDQLNWFGFYFGYGNRLYRSRSENKSNQKMMIDEDSEMYEAIPSSATISDASFSQTLQGQVAGLNITTGNGQPGGDTTINLRGVSALEGNSEALFIIDGTIVTEQELRNLSQNSILEVKVLKGDEALALYGSKGKNGVVIIITKSAENEFSQVKIRKNLQETSFFFPQLQTDAEGHVSFSFTTPEALTKWKLQLLTHTKTLESAVTSLETVTQKELMVIPNAPRFLRQGDEITMSTKIANLTDKQLSGQAKLILIDALTNKDITQKLGILPTGETALFKVDAKGNTQVSWHLTIPDDVSAVQYKILAKSGDFSDGEQSALPVLTNRMLVTETLPMWIRSNESRTFTLDKLKTNTSTTLKHHKLTLEMTSNPAWYAVQALPYLMEYPYDCNEQTFSRYYANALASHIATSNPRIQEVFNQWKNTDALLSNLEKNEELKTILIQETPWLRDAQSETEQKKRIALLFDMNKMNNELTSAKRKLQNNQMNNGAWAWFNGGRPNRYITQHIITGFGHLNKLNVIQNDNEEAMITKAIAYLDAEFVQEYKDLKKYNKDVDLSKDHLSYTQLHYLYMRSFFPQIKKSKEVQTIIDYYKTQIQKYWLSRSLYAKGLMALVTERMEDKSTSKKILKSLKENSMTSDELGMYWKENTSSWHWYQAPIETQALMIEAFSEIEKDIETIDNLKIWLLKNKQTNSWKTTKATTEAVYALLLQGSDWLSVTDMVDVVLGGKEISPSMLEDVKVEAGTGYYKTSWTASEIKPEMATVELSKKGDGIAWGSLYWQYFEDLDKITSAETPLKLKKKLFKKTNTDTGEQISEITAETELKVGDLVRVRIELRSDRAMEFIHMKDMRAAGLEPINVLSQYKYQDGLGYYESTKDASTNFFFDYLPKGVYVFEYDLRVNNAGNMSNGITSIESMYAPEFKSHSEGVRISVENK